MIFHEPVHRYKDKMMHLVNKCDEHLAVFSINFEPCCGTVYVRIESLTNVVFVGRSRGSLEVALDDAINYIDSL